jgi:endoglucanase
MKLLQTYLYIFICCTLLVLTANSPTTAGSYVKTRIQQKALPKSPVQINGQLRVRGRFLQNQFGKTIQLRGMSTHGIQWYGWDRCVTEKSLDALEKDWQADIVRIAMYVQEGGYETNPQQFTEQVDKIISSLIKRGLYVLIDWHILTPGDPMKNLESAKTYFQYMSNKYKDTPNILYEIANEPNNKSGEGQTMVDWKRIKSYAELLIPVIRANDTDGIIIVGTPGWSSLGVSAGSGPSEIYNNPLAGENIMYSFHFYATTHGDNYRKALDEASDKLPIFVTEWGSQSASGDGKDDFKSAQAYIDLMARKKISWINWNYSDDRRSGAVFTPGTCQSGNFTNDNALKESGKWVKKKMKKNA